MESSDPARFMDDLLDFGSEGEDEDEEEEKLRAAARNKEARRGVLPSFTPTALGSALLTVLRPDECSGPFADTPLIEEELEWISNKDAFPVVETFPGFLSSHHDDDVFLPSKQSSPVSVLENTTRPTTTNANGGSSSSGSSIVTSCCRGLPAPPGKRKARSKRSSLQQLQCSWYKHHGIYDRQAKTRRVPLGRKCQHCGVEKTPQWRAGPKGAKTLCNACGVRYKSGRLVPEYRPANSPTFCSELHSNSHRKVVEMRRQKEMIGLPVAKSIDRSVG